jgi:hypothetical protein
VWKPNRALVAVGVVVVAGLAILIFLHRNDLRSQAGLMGTLSPTGAESYRRSYINSSIASCSSGLSSNPAITAKISADTIANYCRCFAEKSVDQISAGDLFQLVVKHTPSPELNAKVQEDAKACAALYLKRPS